MNIFPKIRQKSSKYQQQGLKMQDGGDNLRQRMMQHLEGVKQTDIQTCKQTDIQTDKQADIQTNKQTDIQADKQADIQTNKSRY